MFIKRLNAERDFVPVSITVTFDSIDELAQLWRARKMLPGSSIDRCPDRAIWLTIVSNISLILEPEIRRYVLEPQGREDF